MHAERLWRDPRYRTVLDIAQLAPITPALPYQAFKAANGRMTLPSPSKPAPTPQNGGAKPVLRGSASAAPAYGSGRSPTATGNGGLSSGPLNGSSNNVVSSTVHSALCATTCWYMQTPLVVQVLKPTLRKSLSAVQPGQASTCGSAACS